jgi:uncharacterized protein YdaU (DUF1376 family)
MHFYQHNIGDFDKATRHLSRIERSIYRDLIEFYYDIEKPLPIDIHIVCRKIIAKSNEETTAVEQVLSEFFKETPIGWYHIRCEEELERFRCSTSQKSEAGKASAAKKKEKLKQALNGNSTSVKQTIDGASTKQETITNNQEPLTKEDTAQAPKFNFAKELEIMGVEENAITTWLAVRKKKKAVNSEIALNGFKREVAKAGLSIADAVTLCIEKSWSGLEADWIKPKQHAAPIPQKGLEHLGKHGQATATAAQQWLEESNAG